MHIFSENRQKRVDFERFCHFSRNFRGAQEAQGAPRAAPGFCVLCDGTVNLASRLSSYNIIDKVTLKTNWELSFGIYLFGKVSGWNNIILISAKDMKYNRHPGIWFRSDSYKLHIVHSEGCNNLKWNSHGRVVFDLDNDWKTGQFHKIKFIAVEHETDANASRVSLYIDEVLKKSWTRSDICVGEEAYVYEADNYYNAANVALVDYKYQ